MFGGAGMTDPGLGRGRRIAGVAVGVFSEVGSVRRDFRMLVFVHAMSCHVNTKPDVCVMGKGKSLTYGSLGHLAHLRCPQPSLAHSLLFPTNMVLHL